MITVDQGIRTGELSSEALEMLTSPNARLLDWGQDKYLILLPPQLIQHIIQAVGTANATRAVDILQAFGQSALPIEDIVMMLIKASERYFELQKLDKRISDAETSKMIMLHRCFEADPSSLQDLIPNHNLKDQPYLQSYFTAALKSPDPHLNLKGLALLKRIENPELVFRLLKRLGEVWIARCRAARQVSDESLEEIGGVYSNARAIAQTLVEYAIYLTHEIQPAAATKILLTATEIHAATGTAPTILSQLNNPNRLLLLPLFKDADRATDIHLKARIAALTYCPIEQVNEITLSVLHYFFGPLWQDDSRVQLRSDSIIMDFISALLSRSDFDNIIVTTSIVALMDGLDRHNKGRSALLWDYFEKRLMSRGLLNVARSAEIMNRKQAGEYERRGFLPDIARYCVRVGLFSVVQLNQFLDFVESLSQSDVRQKNDVMNVIDSWLEGIEELVERRTHGDRGPLLSPGEINILSQLLDNKNIDIVYASGNLSGIANVRYHNAKNQIVRILVRAGAQN